MKMRATVAVLVVAFLSGCATTADQPDSEGGAPVTSATPSTTSTATGVTTGTTAGQPLGSETGRASHADGRPDLKRSVYYEFDRYDVKPQYRTLVESHARWLAANPKARLTIEGNTDERGSREYNVALGQRRPVRPAKAKPRGRRTAAAISRDGRSSQATSSVVTRRSSRRWLASSNRVARCIVQRLSQITRSPTRQR
jgi:peptidoglycan-associated lipoprotein